MRFFTLAFLVGAISVLVRGSVLAQYTPPASFWMSPQLTAPTAMSAYDYTQLSAHYQKQAIGSNIGSRSMILSGQLPLVAGKNVRFGTLGLNLIRQESGSAYLFSTTGAMLSYNYTVRLSGLHHLVGGIQGGYFSRRIDWNRATTGNQVVDGQINPVLDHGERFSDYQSRALTTNIGLAYYLTDYRGGQRFHIGAGMINANKGRFTYLENDDNQAEPVRWVAYSQLKLIANPFYELETKMYWQQENAVNDFVGGFQLNKGINPRRSVTDEHLGLGLYYSPDHSATIAMQLMRQNLLLGVSYSLPFGNRELHAIQNVAEVTLGWRMQRSGRGASFYGGSYRGKMPGFKASKSAAQQTKQRSPSYKYKANKKAVRAYKKQIGKKSRLGRKNAFSKKVSSFKARAKKKGPTFKSKKKGRSGIFRKYRSNKPIFKSRNGKKWKPKKSKLRKLRRRKG